MIRKSPVRSLFPWLTFLFLLLPSSLWAKADKEAVRIAPPGIFMESRPWQSEKLISRKKGPSYESDEDFYERLAPEEKDRIRNRSKKWETLPPEKRRELQHRMDQWKSLPPEEKDLMRKRHEQWQELPSKERDRIREKLYRWDSLPPQEQDEIRRKFKRP
jgi:hypothetical protein